MDIWDSDSEPLDYKFSTPDGHQLTRKILRPLLPYDPRDDQLEGVCKMADGIDLMALTRTGSGKTGYWTSKKILRNWSRVNRFSCMVSKTASIFCSLVR